MEAVSLPPAVWHLPRMLDKEILVAAIFHLSEPVGEEMFLRISLR